MAGSRDRDTDDNVGHSPTLAQSSDDAIASGPPTLPDPDDPLIGQSIADRYQIISLLGRGGMGSVYCCEHIQLKKRMALKVLAEEFRRQPTLVARFLKEARAAAQIGHPNIVDVFDLGELSAGGAYIAMALLEGEDLQTAVTHHGPMPFARARPIIGGICRALAAAHAKGIVHRDMKPANVFLARDIDGGEQVKILDFGIAQVNGTSEGDAARLTQTGAIVGTPAFMSPEQGRGQRTDHRSDIYSVGCILYNLITGTVPFEADTLMGVITQHLFDPPMAPSLRAPGISISPELDAVVLRAMAKEPAARFQTMKEMWTAIEACTDAPQEWPDASSGQYPKLTPVPASRSVVSSSLVPARSSRGVLLVGAIVVGALVAVASVSMLRRPEPTPVATPVPTQTDITIELRTTPSGATVLDGDRVLGVTPLSLHRPRSSGALALRITLDQHQDESVSVPLEHDRTVELHLTPNPPTPSPVVAPNTAPVVKPTAAHVERSRQPIPSNSPVRKAGRTGELKDPFAQ